MDLKLTGKRALVTGSSSGIGVGIARMLADEGCKVFVTGRNEERTRKTAEALSANGAQVEFACGDLGTDEGAAAVAKKVDEVFGGLDILVNNAGGAAEGADKSWFGAPLEKMVQTYETNVVAAVRLIRAFAPGMKERGWGRIINIGTAASITPTSAQPDYGPSKAAMLNMSLGLSKALSRTGVTVNTVSPGMVRTEGLMDFMKEFAAKRGWGDDLSKVEDYIMKGGGQTAKDVGEVEDIAYAVTFIASPRSAFISGANIHVDGGITPSIC